jgi:hypothetical protein
MRSLSKEAEQKLIQAIEKAAEYVNSGLAPNDAIVKSAAEHSVPAGHVNLMVHAYNTGRTNKQREQGEDTYEKAADFNLADAETILARLYPKQVKTSAAIRKAEHVSTEYAVPPTGFLARRRSALAKEAAATQTFFSEKAYVAPPRDEHAAAMRAHVQRVAEKRAAEELRRQATMAEHNAAVAMDKLAEYFRVPGNMSFSDALKEVGLRLGPQGVNVLEKVAVVYPHFKKQAATNRDHFGTDQVYTLVENVIDSVNTLVTARNNAPPVKAAAAEKKIVPTHITGSILHNPTTEPIDLKTAAAPRPPAPKTWSQRTNTALFGAQNPKGGGKDSENSTLQSFSKPISTVGEIIGGTVGGKKTDMLASGLGLDVDPAKEKLKAYQDLTAPEHELQLKNIRAQATLHDLMSNDPVISGYNSNEVADAFNDIANTAPNIVESPAVLQAVLRKRLEAGQFADFDVKQLLDMDKTKTERDNTLLTQKKLEQDLI